MPGEPMVAAGSFGSGGMADGPNVRKLVLYGVRAPTLGPSWSWMPEVRESVYRVL